MQLIQLMPRKKKTRDEVKATYRLDRVVKNGVSYTADVAGRSENLQAEYLLKVGLLMVTGINPSGLTPEDINARIEDLFDKVEDDD